MEASRLTPRRSWLFVALSGVVAAGVAYVFDPSDSGVLALVVVECVVSLVSAIGCAVSNGRVKQALIGLLSFLP